MAPIENRHIGTEPQISHSPICGKTTSQAVDTTYLIPVAVDTSPTTKGK